MTLLTQEEKFVLKTLYNVDRYKSNADIPQTVLSEINNLLANGSIQEEKLFLLSSKYPFATERFIVFSSTQYTWDFWGSTCYIIARWGDKVDEQYLLEQAREITKHRIMYLCNEQIEESKKKINMLRLYLNNIDYYIKYAERGGVLEYINID